MKSLKKFITIFKRSVKFLIYFNLIDIYFFLTEKKINFNTKRIKLDHLDKIIYEHFKDKDQKYKSHYSIFIKTFYKALKSLGKNSTIIETGSSAWGIKSSILFDSFVNSFNGKLLTCDLRFLPAFELKKAASEKTTFYNMDSVKFLKKLTHKGINCDLIYLDSWDIDFDDFYPSMTHCLNEFFWADRLIKKGGMILIDDTPANIKIAKKIWGMKQGNKAFSFQKKFNFIPGKGSLIRDIVKQSNKYKIILNEYQLLIKKVI
jgi:hypothetical protein